MSILLFYLRGYLLQVTLGFGILYMGLLFGGSAYADCLPSYANAGGGDLEMVPAGRGSAYCDVYLVAGDIVQLRASRISAGNARYYVRLYDIAANNMVSQTLINTNGVLTRILTATQTGWHHIVWEHFDRTNRRMRLQTTVPLNTAPADNQQSSNLSQNALPVLSQTGMDMTTNLIKRRIQKVRPVHRTQSRYAYDPDGLYRGRNAGDTIKPEFGSWLDVEYTDFGGSENNPQFDGHQVAIAAGFDVGARDNVIFGAAVTLETGEVRTGNNEVTSQRTVYGLSPYIISPISEAFSLTAHGNISYGNNEVSTDTESQSEDTLRWSLGLQADLRKNWGHLGLLVGVGVTYMQEDVLSDGGNGSLSTGVTEAGDISLHLQPSYRFNFSEGRYLEPYFSTTYRYQYMQASQSQQTGNIITLSDDRDLRLGLGVRYQYDLQLSGALEGSHLFWQNDYTETRLNARIELKF